jgi:hypothetical protein
MKVCAFSGEFDIPDGFIKNQRDLDEFTERLQWAISDYLFGTPRGQKVTLKLKIESLASNK